MKEKTIFNNFQVLSTDPKEMKKQFVGICEYLIKNVDNIIHTKEKMSTTRNISLKIDMKASEIITIITKEEKLIDFGEEEENER